MKYILFSICLTFIFSCKGDPAPTSQPAQAVPEPVVEEKPAEVIVFAWVDKLRLREKPNTKSPIVKELSEGEPLVFTGDKTDFTQEINLRGIVYDEPWMKVITAEDKVGWVFAGGVKMYQKTTDKSSSPYDQCYKLLELGNENQFKNCELKVKEAQLKKYNAFIKPDPQGYKINLLSGDQLALFDNDPNSLGRGTSIDFRTYYPELGYFVFRMYADSIDQYVLVNDKDGTMMPLWGFPKPSIAHDHLISLSMKNDDKQVNGVQLLSFTDDGLTIQHEHDFLDAKPLIAKWVENNEVELTIKQPSGKSEQVTFTVGDGEWK